MPLTGPSHASLLCAVPPQDHGAQDNGWQIAPEVETLAEGLGARGYATAAVISAAVLHRDLCGLQRGFDEYDDSFRPADPLRRLVFVAAAERLVDWITGRARGLSHQRRALETVDIGVRFLRRHPDQPYFLWLHFYDPHAPYQPISSPPSSETLPPLLGEPGENPAYGELRRAYAAEIRDLDAALGRLSEHLDDSGLFESTLLVVVSDHGESFGTHGRGYRFDHGAYLFDDALRLGAWWREPGAPGGTPIDDAYRIDELGQAMSRRLLEGAPSLRAALPSSRGFTLSHSSVAGDTLWCSLRRPDRKLLVGQHGEEASFFEAYDLALDPQEQRQLLELRHPPSRATGDSLGCSSLPDWIADETRLLEYAGEIRRSLMRERPELSEDARERLRSLGYLR